MANVTRCEDPPGGGGTSRRVTCSGTGCRRLHKLPTRLSGSLAQLAERHVYTVDVIG